MALRSRVKHSTTEPLRSLEGLCTCSKIHRGDYVHVVKFIEEDYVHIYKFEKGIKAAVCVLLLALSGIMVILIIEIVVDIGPDRVDPGQLDPHSQ